MSSTNPATSLTSDAYHRLRSEIIQGKIRPNERLIAADLAERLAISRTPVREALQLLASEGLVVGVKRGYVVRDHTADEIRQIYEVRAALEGMAARLAAERANDLVIAEIEALGAHHKSLVLEDRQVLVDANSRFHAAIMQAAGNPRLEQINQRNGEHFFNHEIAQLYTDGEARTSVRGHERILRALRERKPNAAEVAARQHVREALEVALRKLR